MVERGELGCREHIALQVSAVGIRCIGTHRYRFTKGGTYRFEVKNVDWEDVKAFNLAIERHGIGNLDGRECLAREEKNFRFDVDVQAHDDLALWVRHAMKTFKEAEHGPCEDFEPKKNTVEFYSDKFKITLKVR